MEGPTPVSSLLHAATMVCAGVILLFRVNVIMGGPILSILAIVGGLTLILAALTALHQPDFKRVVAYSTLSQLGYMVLAVSLPLPEVALFHMWCHSFFKALLFMCSGLVIHCMAEDQDLRTTGGVYLVLPFTAVCSLMATLALAGAPFLSGFYSKEPIILSAVYAYGPLGS